MALARTRGRRRRSVLPRWRSRVRQFGITLVFVLVGSGLWYTQEQEYRDQLKLALEEIESAIEEDDHDK